MNQSINQQIDLWHKSETFFWENVLYWITKVEFNWKVWHLKTRRKFLVFNKTSKKRICLKLQILFRISIIRLEKVKWTLFSLLTINIAFMYSATVPGKTSIFNNTFTKFMIRLSLYIIFLQLALFFIKTLLYLLLFTNYLLFFLHFNHQVYLGFKPTFFTFAFKNISLHWKSFSSEFFNILMWYF